MLEWHLLSGAYPPVHGGVSDYTYLLAEELCRRGLPVRVWTSTEGAEPVRPELPDPDLLEISAGGGSWRAGDFARVSAQLDLTPKPRRLVVQYSPNLWKRKGMNLAFVRFIEARRNIGDEIRLMIHEPFYFPSLFDKPARRVLAIVQRFMMRRLLKASRIVYLSIPWWEQPLARFLPNPAPPRVWAPVPSNIPVANDPQEVERTRTRFAARSGAVVGAFTPFGASNRKFLTPHLIDLLIRIPDCTLALLGGESEAFATELRTRHPRFAERIAATGRLPAAGLSIALQACDAMLQLYPEGVSSRRGTIMAVLEHGLPAVLNLGESSESLWSDCGAVAVADPNAPGAPTDAISALLRSAELRDRIRSAGRELYAQKFAVERTADLLLQSAAEAVAADPLGV